MGNFVPNLKTLRTSSFQLLIGILRSKFLYTNKNMYYGGRPVLDFTHVLRLWEAFVLY